MKWKPGKLAKDTGLLTIGMGLRAFSQGLVFIIIARSMGATGYGAFVSMIAIAGMLSGLVGFGSQVLLTRDTALNSKQFNQAWGHTLLSVAISSPLILLIYLFISYFVLSNNISWLSVLLIGIADLVFWPLSNICVSAYQGFERIGRVARMLLAPVFMRLLVAFVFLYIITYTEAKNNMLEVWSILYLIASFLSSVYTQWLVHKNLGSPVFLSYNWFRRIRESLPFAFWATSDKLYIDADKVMLARMTSLDVTGIYSAAYRFIDIFLLPLHSLIGAATPRFFIEGNKGIYQSLRYSLSLIKLPIIYSLLISISIFFLANIIPFILGESFKGSIDIIRYLAWIPLVILPKIFLRSILATTGLQKMGMQIILFGAFINITLNLFLIPALGWAGAAMSTYLAEISMSIIMAILIYKSLRKETFQKQAI